MINCHVYIYIYVHTTYASTYIYMYLCGPASDVSFAPLRPFADFGLLSSSIRDCRALGRAKKTMSIDRRCSPAPFHFTFLAHVCSFVNQSPLQRYNNPASFRTFPLASSVLHQKTIRTVGSFVMAQCRHRRERAWYLLEFMMFRSRQFHLLQGTSNMQQLHLRSTSESIRHKLMDSKTTWKTEYAVIQI